MSHHLCDTAVTASPPPLQHHRGDSTSGTSPPAWPITGCFMCQKPLLEPVQTRPTSIAQVWLGFAPKLSGSAACSRAVLSPQVPMLGTTKTPAPALPWAACAVGQVIPPSSSSQIPHFHLIKRWINLIILINLIRAVFGFLWHPENPLPHWVICTCCKYVPQKIQENSAQSMSICFQLLPLEMPQVHFVFVFSPTAFVSFSEHLYFINTFHTAYMSLHGGIMPGKYLSCFSDNF